MVVSMIEIETAPQNDRTYPLLPGSPDVRQLMHPTFGSWVSFRKTLRPRYALVWSEIALCIFMMIGGFAAHILASSIRGNLFGLEVGAFFALWIGFWLNSLLTFGHEAAHYNLSASRARNDVLADWTIWLFFPESTANYRRSHWQHHLHLGDPDDTEISYHNCLSPWFLARALTGIYLVELTYRYIFLGHSRSAAGTGMPRARSSQLIPALRSATTHLLFVGVAIAFHAYASAAVWIVGVVFVFPFCASIRQILEHRGEDQSCSTDFAQVPHGPVNRLFGSDPFSRYFGAAGFNRHLLHHWDPTISYTCFGEMQLFLDGTPLRSLLDRAHTSYASAFLALLRKARNDGE